MQPVASLAAVTSGAASHAGATVASRREFLEGAYEVLEKLGSGSTSSVVRARRRSDGRLVALKTVRSSDPEMLRVAREEYELLRRLDHPSIVRALDFHALGGHDVIVLELFEGRPLEEALAEAGGLPEAVARAAFAQLLGALAYLHARGILHRDLNPRNVLVSADFQDLRLVDFNTATSRQSAAGCWDGDPLTPTGTPLYAAPEVLAGESPSEPSDVWTAGLCLFFMLSGRLPQGRDQGDDLSRAFLEAAAAQEVKLRGRGFFHVSDACRAVLRSCLALEKEARATPEEVLRGEWLSEAVDGEDFEMTVGKSKSHLSTASTCVGDMAQPMLSQASYVSTSIEEENGEDVWTKETKAV